ncbi:MAG: cysteine hydrolase [Clostridium sp.]|jgi:nicotinamidase-related amidase|nr:cysteine hydrolase [Clostridium sp.]
MKKLLIVVDMQNDFIDGSLGTDMAQAIVSNVKAKIQAYKAKGDAVLFTRDTHPENYLETREGTYLPVAHCIKGTNGHRIFRELDTTDCEIFDKPTFGSLELAKHVAEGGYDEVELCGLCTDICVVSNALILKAQLPEAEISVDGACCAGVTVESHKAALLTMKMCQVVVRDEGET